ncbi:hypothetical protein NKJ40_14575 [Mesorhizobium sp. M0119]|uniref:hypothetical protein n=1 Tax=Mesorhizobium sp. M0119 TaxID=2956885 RepID=UPI0033353302
MVGNHGKPDAAAAVMFPSERKAEAPPPAGKDDDPAAILFKDDAARKDVDYERAVGGELDQFALDAMKIGDSEQATALKAATVALSEDFRASGTDPTSIQEAFTIVPAAPRELGSRSGLLPLWARDRFAEKERARP